MKKTDMVREAVKSRNYKAALKLAKGFRINVSAEQREAMTRAYECIVHPEFYRQIGINLNEAIENGQKVLVSLYGT